MHSVSLCRGLSLLLLLAQLAIADDSLGLGNIHSGDTPHGLSLSTFSPPDGSLSSEDLGINAATEPFTADGGNWGKAQGSFKNGDSLELASGVGNCKSDAGNTRPGRRRLRRDNDFCSSGYSQFKPSLPKVSHDPAGWGGGLWGTPAAGPFSHAPLANRFYPEGAYMYFLQTQPAKSDIQNLLDVFPVNRGGPDRDPEPEQSNLLMPYFGQGSDAEKSACANSGVKTVGNIPVCALDSDAFPAFTGLVGLEALDAIVNLKAWTPYSPPGCLKPEALYCCNQVSQRDTGLLDPPTFNTPLSFSPSEETPTPLSSIHINDEYFLAQSCVRVPDL